MNLRPLPPISSSVLYLVIDDGLVHIALVSLSIVLLVISLLAYSRRQNTRFLFLTLGFFFLFLSQVVSLCEVFLLSDYLVIIPVLGIHLSHFLDLLMLLSFVTAIARNWGSTNKGAVDGF